MVVGVVLWIRYIKIQCTFQNEHDRKCKYIPNTLFIYITKNVHLYQPHVAYKIHLTYLEWSGTSLTEISLGYRSDASM